MTDGDQQLELALGQANNSIELAKAKDLLRQAQGLIQALRDEVQERKQDCALVSNQSDRWKELAERNRKEADTNDKLRREALNRLQEQSERLSIRETRNAELRAKLELVPLWIRRIFGAD